MSMASRNSRRKKEGKTTWLISFTDVITLMLTFFVLLFSMSEPEQGGWAAATGGLNSAFRSSWGSKGSAGLDQSQFNIDSLELGDGLNLDYLSSLLTTLFSKNTSFKDIVVTSLDDRVVVSVPSRIIFSSGSANLSSNGENALNSLSTVLMRLDNRLQVHGHADPRPVQSGAFVSNWELSTARARAVAVSLYKFGYDFDITVQGFADTRYDDLSEDFPEEFRRELARRVDIVIQKERHE